MSGGAGGGAGGSGAASTLLADLEYARRSSARASSFLPASGKAKRKRGSRGNSKKKGERPYSALTWQEKLALEDDERRRGAQLLVASEFCHFTVGKSSCVLCTQS